VKHLVQSVALGGLLAVGVFSASAEATIEGTVLLPKVCPDAIAQSRYHNKTPGEVGPPPAPVAVVYLEGNFPASTATNSTISAKVLQERFRFLPAVLPVRTGTSVEFPNLDDSYHNVFSYSKPKRFDLGRYTKDEKPAAVLFDKPGVVKLFCEIHEHMRATVLVLDTPHFTRTDTNGNFRLEHVPAGKYTLKVWIDEKTQLEGPVDLKDGAVSRVDFTSR
jgi:plastocyanin